MATIIQSQLVAPVAMTNADAAYYTAASLTSGKIGRAIFCNTDTVAHPLTMNITSGASGASNTFISARAISPGETYVAPELAGAVIPAGQSLRGLSHATVTISVSGIVVTGQ
jgi:hypothetical protein